MLVGIEQRPDGSIEPETEKFLAEMAAWIQVNGEVIFGTRPWKTYGEGPLILMPKKKLPWGPAALYQDQPFTADDIRFTQSKDGKTLYAIALGVTASEVRIRSLVGIKIGCVKLLGSEVKIQWCSETNALVIQPVTNWPSEIAVAWQIKVL